MQINSDKDGIDVDIFDLDAGARSEVVYVWLGNDNTVVRIGTSKQPVASRISQYPKHINAALAGRPSPTPYIEARSWLDLVRTGPIKALVHQPPCVETICGPIRPYLDIERTLLSRYKTQLNRSHR
jgi:hypothetical protein